MCTESIGRIAPEKQKIHNPIQDWSHTQELRDTLSRLKDPIGTQANGRKVSRAEEEESYGRVEGQGLINIAHHRESTEIGLFINQNIVIKQNGNPQN